MKTAQMVPWCLVPRTFSTSRKRGAGTTRHFRNLPISRFYGFTLVVSEVLSRANASYGFQFQLLQMSMMTTTMKPPVQPFNTFSLLLLSLPTVCGGELDDMKIMGLSWPAVAVAIGNHTGNHTDPDDDDQSHANEMAANILGYTLIGIVVLMFFFTVATFGRSCCIGCKNCCVVFSRHGCKGCCRYMRGRRPEGGDAAAAGILNEVIFDQEQEEPNDEGESGLGRGLLTDA
mmetsp:Transcript_2130/g.3593  ORF Transcript_2130/g.3593 Transcript_2130/m.3593 type:complete len:231 (-) Transcript_2130:198-890(-)